MKTALLFLCLLIPALARAEAITNVNLGSSPSSGTGDPARVAFDRLNRNDNLLQSQAAATGVIAHAEMLSISNAAVYFPKTFGAVGDGVTDDSTALQTLLNALPTGATLDGEWKTYAVSAGLIQTHTNISIERIKLSTTSTTICVLSNKGDYFTLRDAVITGVTNTATRMVGFASGANLAGDYNERMLVQNVLVKNCYQGVRLTYSDNPCLQGVRVLGFASNGIASFLCDQQTIQDCYPGFFYWPDSPDWIGGVGNPQWTNSIAFCFDGGISVRLNSCACNTQRRALYDSGVPIVLENCDFEANYGATNEPVIQITNVNGIYIVNMRFVGIPGAGNGTFGGDSLAAGLNYMSALRLENCYMAGTFIHNLDRPAIDASAFPLVSTIDIFTNSVADINDTLYPMISGRHNSLIITRTGSTKLIPANNADAISLQLIYGLLPNVLNNQAWLGKQTFNQAIATWLTVSNWTVQPSQMFSTRTNASVGISADGFIPSVCFLPTDASVAPGGQLFNCVGAYVPKWTLKAVVTAAIFWPTLGVSKTSYGLGQPITLTNNLNIVSIHWEENGSPYYDDNDIIGHPITLGSLTFTNGLNYITWTNQWGSGVSLNKKKGFFLYILPALTNTTPLEVLEFDVRAVDGAPPSF